MLIEISEIDMKEFLDWANQRAFCNSGQHVIDRIATTFEGTPAEDRYGRDVKPDKVKPLTQYVNEYIEHEVELGNIHISCRGIEMMSADYDTWGGLLEQALDAYQSTENVKIRIEPV